MNGEDLYFPNFFDGLDKEVAYRNYLKAILNSTNVNFDYDIITHIGYATRNAPYENKAMYLCDYKELIDEILKNIINKNKCLEINSHVTTHDSPFMPSREIIERYIELGGENISFGSDSHKKDSLCEKFELIRDYLLSKNIKYLTYYLEHKQHKFKL